MLNWSCIVFLVLLLTYQRRHHRINNSMANGGRILRALIIGAPGSGKGMCTSSDAYFSKVSFLKNVEKIPGLRSTGPVLPNSVRLLLNIALMLLQWFFRHSQDSYCHYLDLIFMTHFHLTLPAPISDNEKNLT